MGVFEMTKPKKPKIAPLTVEAIPPVPYTFDESLVKPVENHQGRIDISTELAWATAQLSTINEMEGAAVGPIKNFYDNFRKPLEDAISAHKSVLIPFVNKQFKEADEQRAKSEAEQSVSAALVPATVVIEVPNTIKTEHGNVVTATKTVLEVDVDVFLTAIFDGKIPLEFTKCLEVGKKRFNALKKKHGLVDIPGVTEHKEKYLKVIPKKDD